MNTKRQPNPFFANRVRPVLWLACVCFLTAQPCFAGFKFAGRLVTPRGKHTATLLQDGRVLIAGGTDKGLYNASAKAEIYDPSTGLSTATGDMNVGRRSHGAVLLPDGRVLVIGGHYANSTSVQACEIYDPATGVWTLTGLMPDGQSTVDPVLLPNGKVLSAASGSSDPSYAFVYDPASGVWSFTGRLNQPRFFGCKMTLLPSGSVLLAGGGIGSPLAAELYDPATGTWSVTGSLHAPRD
jgi:hypothetical protein